MARKSTTYTADEILRITDVAKLLYAQHMTQPGGDDELSLLDHCGRYQSTQKLDCLRRHAETCFEAALVFEWARHRVLDNCPEYKS